MIFIWCFCWLRFFCQNMFHPGDLLKITSGFFLCLGRKSFRECCQAAFKKKTIHLHPGRLTWNLQITHLERKMIWTKPPWLWSILIFQGVSSTGRFSRILEGFRGQILFIFYWILRVIGWKSHLFTVLVYCCLFNWFAFLWDLVLSAQPGYFYNSPWKWRALSERGLVGGGGWAPTRGYWCLFMIPLTAPVSWTSSASLRFSSKTRGFQVPFWDVEITKTRRFQTIGMAFVFGTCPGPPVIQLVSFIESIKS